MRDRKKAYKIKMSETTIHEKKHRKTGLRILLCLLILVAGVAIADAIYYQNCYKATGDADSAMSSATLIDDALTYGSPTAEYGLIIYPGAMVDYTAYAPLAQKIADYGIFTVVVRMPQNMAFLDKNAADDIMDMYPDIQHWYVGGHSLGGAMAGEYASENLDKLDGVVMLAAFSLKDVSSLKAISVYGSEDGVLNHERYEEAKANLGQDLRELVIDGGNHANFGCYGMQKGDNASPLTGASQQDMTAEFVASNILD